MDELVWFFLLNILLIIKLYEWDQVRIISDIDIICHLTSSNSQVRVGNHRRIWAGSGSVIPVMSTPVSGLDLLMMLFQRGTSRTQKQGARCPEGFDKKRKITIIEDVYMLEKKDRPRCKTKIKSQNNDTCFITVQ